MNEAYFDTLTVFPDGTAENKAEFVTAAVSQSFELNAIPEPFHEIANNPAFDFWKDPGEDIYEGA